MPQACRAVKCYFDTSEHLGRTQCEPTDGHPRGCAAIPFAFVHYSRLHQKPQRVAGFLVPSIRGDLRGEGSYVHGFDHAHSCVHIEDLIQGKLVR